MTLSEDDVRRRIASLPPEALAVAAHRLGVLPVRSEHRAARSRRAGGVTIPAVPPADGSPELASSTTGTNGVSGRPAGGAATANGIGGVDGLSDRDVDALLAVLLEERRGVNGGSVIEPPTDPRGGVVEWRALLSGALTSLDGSRRAEDQGWTEFTAASAEACELLMAMEPSPDDLASLAAALLAGSVLAGARIGLGSVSLDQLRQQPI
ncbi:MAG: hypothetical protein ACYDH6_19545 [Acidimicrobiales bacterium]